MQIGQMLLGEGALTAQDIENALREQAASTAQPQRIGAILVRRGVVSEATLYTALARQLGLPLWQRADPDRWLPRAVASLRMPFALPEPLAKRWEAFASADGPDAVRLIARDPLLPELQEYVSSRSGARRVTTMLAPGQDMASALAALYEPGARQEGAVATETGDLRQLAQDAPIVEFVASMLARGTDLSASDIHIEPTESGFNVRYRVDGELRQTEHHPRAKFDPVSSRLKLIAGLDIAERRLPQDGRFSTRAAGIDTEVRVSVIPGVHGESTVLRLLPKTENRRFQLGALGLEPDHLAMLQHWLTATDGIILVTGPTGSGKSTTLYAALAATSSEAVRVLTVEDPVEYQLPGITQFQVQTDIGFTFPAALRAILRHDPDTIMVGEIRDTETARIAIQASLTGHKVLSTLHTNDAVSAFVRLVDMGVEPYLLAASVRGVIAQRLVRRLCPHCAVPHPASELPARITEIAQRLSLRSEAYAGRKASGCTQCSHTGYRGRVGVHEFLPVSDALRQLLSADGFSQQALRAAAGHDFRALQHDALLKFWRSETSLTEVLSLPNPESARDALIER